MGDSAAGLSDLPATAQVNRSVAVLRAALTILGISALCYAIPVYLYYRQPVAYVYLIAEDSYGEWTTFFAWLFAFALALVALWRRSALRRAGFVLFALATLFVAMEEISWGQHIFHFQAPASFKAINTQGETNVHNLVRSRDYAFINYVIAAWSVVVPLVLLRVRSFDRVLARSGLPMVPLYLAPLFLVALLYETAIGLPIVWITDASLSLSEVGELYLALAAMLLALHFLATDDLLARPRGALSPFAIGGAMAVVAVVVLLAGSSLAATRFLGDERPLKDRLNHFAATVYPGQGQDLQAEMIFDYLDRHPDFADAGTQRWSADATRIKYAEILTREGRTQEAAAVLARALAEQDEQLRVAREERALVDSGKWETVVHEESYTQRNRGRIFQLLGRDAEAQAAFESALELDRTPLTGADPDTEAWAHWSLARTYFAMGDRESARREAMLAIGRRPDGALRKVIEEWIDELLGD